MLLYCNHRHHLHWHLLPNLLVNNASKCMLLSTYFLIFDNVGSLLPIHIHASTHIRVNHHVIDLCLFIWSSHLAVGPNFRSSLPESLKSKIIFCGGNTLSIELRVLVNHDTGTDLKKVLELMRYIAISDRHESILVDCVWCCCRPRSWAILLAMMSPTCVFHIYIIFRADICCLGI